jgi:DNA polymerase III delta subunit
VSLPSPILIIGDQFLSKNNVTALKKKYAEQYRWVELSASQDSTTEIRTQAGLVDFFCQPKVLLISDLPNKNVVRKVLLDLCSLSDENTKFIVWDSTNAIKIDTKTKEPNKTWSDFIDKFKKIPNSKFINNGAEFTEKDGTDCLSFVASRFLKHKKKISDDALKMFVNIVGKNRGLLLSEIEKICLSPNETIPISFIIENTFPTSKEAVLSKFSNVLDEKYASAIIMLDHFLEAGVNANVIAEIMAKKARWQLAACYLYSKGMSWEDVSQEIINMGKFPSCVWNSNLPYNQKQNMALQSETQEGLDSYIQHNLGLPRYYFFTKKKKIKAKIDKNEDENTLNEEASNEDDTSGNKLKNPSKKLVVLGKKEILPMPFLAKKMTSYLDAKFVIPYINKLSSAEIKSRLLDHALNVYLEVINGLKEIRYGDDVNQNLYNMVQLLTNDIF